MIRLASLAAVALATVGFHTGCADQPDTASTPPPATQMKRPDGTSISSPSGSPTDASSAAAPPLASTAPGPANAPGVRADAPTPVTTDSPPPPTPSAAMPSPQPAGLEAANDRATSPPADDKVARFLGLTAPKPATWLWQPLQQQMRAANYTIPGQNGGEQAQLVVFYFGQGQGGDKQGNINRWITQFRPPTMPDGTMGTVTPQVTEVPDAALPITLVELAGDWMPTGASNFVPNQIMLGAIVESAIGNVFIRFGGPAATIEANREAFMTMLRNLKPVEHAPTDPAGDSPASSPQAAPEEPTK